MPEANPAADSTLPDPRASTAQHILHWMRQTPTAPAIIEQDRTYCYGDLAAGIAQWVRALSASSVRAGMLVGLQHRRRYLHLLLIQACQVIGATSVSLSPADIAANDPILARCDFLCLQDEIARPADGCLVLSQAVIDHVSRLAVSGADLARLDHCPDDETVVRLVRTSGSLGRAKVMAMTQRAMNTLAEKTETMPDDPGHPWNFINLYDYTLRSALQETEIALRHGRTAVSSTMETVVADLDRVEGFHLTLVSGDARRLAAAVSADAQSTRAGLISVKGGTMDLTTRRILRERVASDVYHNYAANEVHRIAMLDEDGLGTILPDMTVRIVDETGVELPPDTIGLIEVRPTLMDGYLWDEEATALAFHDGWYRTFDLGRMPAPNRLVVLGRADDVVSIGGVKFAPEGMESRLRGLPGLRGAALLALTAGDGTEELVVVLETDLPGVSADLRGDIGSILAGMVAHYRPVLMADLPRTSTGKIRRGALRAMLEAPLSD